MTDLTARQAEAPPEKQTKLLQETRRILRLHHYFIHAERSYVDWIVRYVRFRRMARREGLLPGEPKIEGFLSHLATVQNVAPAMQNQAMNALVFLYKHVLKETLNEAIDAIRAERKLNVPVVLTREEVAAILPRLQGVPHNEPETSTSPSKPGFRPPRLAGMFSQID